MGVDVYCRSDWVAGVSSDSFHGHSFRLAGGSTRWILGGATFADGDLKFFRTDQCLKP